MNSIRMRERRAIPLHLSSPAPHPRFNRPKRFGRMALVLGLLACATACGGGGGEAEEFSGVAPSEFGLEVNSPAPFQVIVDENGTLSTGSASYTVTNTLLGESRQFRVTSQESWVQVLTGSTYSVPAGGQTVVSLGFNGVTLSALGTGLHECTIVIDEPSHPEFGTIERTIEATVQAPEAATDRVTNGLLALYEFDENSGTAVNDTSGVHPPLPLQIVTPSTVLWQPGVLVLDGDSEISSPGAATKITNACKLTDEITIEAWITPETVSQSGPARVISLSDGSLDRNITLGHGGSGSEPSTGYNVRTRTSTGTVNGLPALLTGANEVLPQLHHVVYTRRADGVARVYVNGAIVATANGTGNFSNWNTAYRLALGNELGASRAWYGKFHLVAIYERALLQTEVDQNLEAGPLDQPYGNISVSPGSDFVSFGITGSDFSSAAQVYRVSNAGSEPVSWRVLSSRPWAYIDGIDDGFLPPGGSADVTVRLDAALTASLTAGTYSANLDFTNLTNGYGNTRLHAQLILSDPGDPTGKPGPNNTGPSNPAILAPSSSITANVNGQVIENVNINGTITIAANNVTIRNFRINGQGASYGIATGLGPYSGTVIEDGEIYNVNSAGLFGANFTARRLNIHESGGDGIKARDNVLVENCWIHHVGTNPGAHADGDQTRAGHNLVFRHNNIDMPVSNSPNGQSGYLSNAAFIIQDELGSIDNFLIEDNWLNGGNYTIMLAHEGSGPTNLRFINNRFGRDYRYGTLTTDGLSYFASGNVWDDTGLPMSWNNH